jgi:hypothetical protein
MSSVPLMAIAKLKGLTTKYQCSFFTKKKVPMLIAK